MLIAYKTDFAEVLWIHVRPLEHQNGEPLVSTNFTILPHPSLRLFERVLKASLFPVMRLWRTKWRYTSAVWGGQGLRCHGPHP